MKRDDRVLLRCSLPLYPITIGTLLEFLVLNRKTASFPTGSIVVVATEVVDVTVGVISSHS